MPRLNKEQKAHPLLTLESYNPNDPELYEAYSVADYVIKQHHRKTSEVSHFLKTGELNNLTVDDLPVYTDYNNCDEFYAIIDGVIIGFELGDKPDLQTVPSAVILPKIPRKKGNKNFKHIAILNGDEGGDSFMSTRDEPVCLYSMVNCFKPKENIPTVSFRCLAELTYTDVYCVGEMLATSKLEVVDYTSDITLPLRESDKKYIRSRKPINRLKPPKPGFTYVNRKWHQSATVVIRNKQEGETYLIGQDEGTYFGCVLPEDVKTIAGAYKALMPPEARKVNPTRQGEWFFVPVEVKNMPKRTECDLLFEDSIIMPIDDEDANFHYLMGGGGCVHKGRIYCHNPEMEHDDHLTVVLKGWYAMYRNTALRSVSVDGVD